MKALSVRQPWAWLLAHGYKDVENRKWATTYRGPILIHASNTVDPRGYEVAALHSLTPPPPHLIERGGIVGQARIVDCVHGPQASPWFEGPWGFVMADATPIALRKCPGKLGFFEPGYEGGESHARAVH